MQNAISEENKQRQDNTVRIVPLELCQTFWLIGEIKWYNQKSKNLVKNIMELYNASKPCCSTEKPWYSCAVQNGKAVSSIDVFVSVDNIVELKKQENLENYSNLKQGVKTI